MTSARLTTAAGVDLGFARPPWAVQPLGNGRSLLREP